MMKFLFAVVIVSLLIPTSTAFAEQNTFAQGDVNQPLPPEEIAKAKQIAEADNQVQKYFDGKPYYLANYQFVSNESTKGIMYPTLHYIIAGKDSLFVIVDLNNGVVKDITFEPGPVFPPPSPQERESNAATLTPLIVPIAAVVGAGGLAAAIVFVIARRKKSRNLAV